MRVHAASTLRHGATTSDCRRGVWQQMWAGPIAALVPLTLQSPSWHDRPGVGSACSRIQATCDWIPTVRGNALGIVRSENCGQRQWFVCVAFAMMVHDDEAGTVFTDRITAMEHCGPSPMKCGRQRDRACPAPSPLADAARCTLPCPAQLAHVRVVSGL